MATPDQDCIAAPDPLARASLPPRVRNVLGRVLAEVTAAMAGPLARALHDAGASLRNPGAGAEPRAQPAASLDRLEDGVDGIRSRFLAALETSLVRLRQPQAAVADAVVAPRELRLSLLDDDDANDEAMLEASASRAEVRNSLALQLLAHRLGVLAGGPVFEMDAMPLGPQRLARAFIDAIGPLQLGRRARSHLFEQFNAHVMTAYPPLLHSVNATLVGQGVLPHLEFIPARPRTAARHPSDPIRPDAVHAPPPRAEAGADEARFQALQGLLHQRRALLARLRPGGATAALPAVPGDVVAQLLRSLRALPEPPATLAQARAGLLQHARQRQGQAVALSQADADTFELLDLFFHHLQRELLAGSPGEALLVRLRLPLLQLALRDHRFLVDAAHPARQLLEAVSLAGARWLGEDDLAPQWLAALQHAVATVELDADAAADTFASANRALQERLQVLARGVELGERRQVEAARGREKLALARIHASGQINRRIAGRALPKFEAILLAQAWADVLALGHLRHVEGSGAWDRLMWATGRIVDRAAGAPDGDPDPALFGLVGTALEQVGYHRSDAQAIATQLTGCGGDAIDPGSRTGLLLQLRARARLGEGIAGEPQPLSLDAPAQVAFDRMKRTGARLWIEREEAPGRHVRRRLAWASARTGQTLLLNRRGRRVPADPLVTLAQDVASGRIVLLAEDLAPAETAWRALNGGLQRLASGDAAEAGAEAGDGR